MKVYLHLEDSPTQTVVAAQDSAPAGTRVFRRDGAGEAQFGTVTGWTTDGAGIFVSFDQGGTYAGPTFRSVLVAGSGDGRSEVRASRWVVSDVTVDGCPLDGVEDGHYCDYEGHPPGRAARLGPPAPPSRRRTPAHRGRAAAPYRHRSGQDYRRAHGRPAPRHLRLAREHAEWRAERADLSAAEEAGRYVAGDDWHDSDDAGCDLADRAIALLAEVTGQASPGCEPTPSTPAAISLMRSALAESQTTQAHPEAAAASQPRSGPAR